MLFLYRPPQTWLPYSLPRNMSTQQQREYNLRQQDRFNATRRTPAPAPERPVTTKLRALADLHDSGVLNDDEFEAFKAKLLAGDSETA